MPNINFEVTGELADTLARAKKTGRFKTNVEILRYGLSLVRKEIEAVPA
jgi:Arc/MetJ-type ribon-helix-helix transcriptional regulator